VRAIALARVDEIAGKIEDLRRMHAMLKHLVSECDGHGNLAGCPIIEVLLEDDLHGSSSECAKPHHER
jgi:hypothetical protein